MKFDLIYFIHNILLGAAVSADAFSVSLANGLGDPGMKKSRMLLIAGTFSVFQMLMPLAGWFCVHALVQHFHALLKVTPWIAFFLLGWLGVRMLRSGLRRRKDESLPQTVAFTLTGLLLQAVAPSLDALSLGFTMADYTPVVAVVTILIIGAVTLNDCLIGLALGRHFGARAAWKASVFGGVVLILIGIEILAGSF